jgi:glyoxylase-like metal-dependent hydrolase (beta-lactamase superfamily II)
MIHASGWRPRSIGRLLVKQMRVGKMQNFVYLLADELSKEAIAVDSGWETDPIVERAARDGLRVKFAVATHNHFDHTSTLQELAKMLYAKVVAHENSPIPHDLSVKDGDILRLGRKNVRVIYTPGHTEDSICLYDGENLFTGDTLFIGNCGRTDLPGGSPEKMFKSLHNVILKLPAETIVYPGHDYGDAPFRKLGEEARLNPTLCVRSYSEFLAIP